MATEVLKQEADNDGFVTDETEVTVVGDGDDDLGAHLVQPEEDNGRRRILRGQKKLVTVAGVEQHDDAPPMQAPAYETPRVKTLRRGRTRLVKVAPDRRRSRVVVVDVSQPFCVLAKQHHQLGIGRVVFQILEVLVRVTTRLHSIHGGCAMVLAVNKSSNNNIAPEAPLNHMNGDLWGK